MIEYRVIADMPVICPAKIIILFCRVRFSGRRKMECTERKQKNAYSRREQL